MSETVAISSAANSTSNLSGGGQQIEVEVAEHQQQQEPCLSFSKIMTSEGGESRGALEDEMWFHGVLPREKLFDFWSWTEISSCVKQ